MSDSISEGAKGIFKEHQEEIRRRSSVAANFSNENTTFEKVDDDVLIPFKDEEQSYIVFSLSHKEFGPICRDATNPGLCVYGAFETLIEAQEYAVQVARKHNSYSILIDETHKWLGGWSCPAHLQDPEHVASTVTRILEYHEEKAKQEKEEFESNVRQQRCGVDVGEKQEEKQKTTDSKEKKDGLNETDHTAKKDKIDKSLAVEDQSLYSVSVLSDPSSDAEFLFKVYAFHDKEQSANAYIRNVCGCHVIDHNIDVVKARTWIFPQKMNASNAPKEVYRSSELDSIMKTHKGSQGKVDEFYRQNPAYASTNEAPQITEVNSVTNEAPPVTEVNSMTIEAPLEAISPPNPSSPSPSPPPRPPLSANPSSSSPSS